MGLSLAHVALDTQYMMMLCTHVSKTAHKVLHQQTSRAVLTAGGCQSVAVAVTVSVGAQPNMVVSQVS